MASTTQATTTYLKDYKQPDYWVKHVDLTLDIRDGETFVTAKMQVERNGNHNKPLVLDGEDIELKDIKLNGVPLDSANGDYTTDHQSLTMNAGLTSDSFELETMVRIEPEKNTQLSGLYKSGKTYSTQCEPLGFRRITYFVDRPDNMATYTTKMIGDEKGAPVLLSNGNKTGEGKMPDGRHYTTWEDPFPKPSYLFAAVGGDLDFIEDKYTTMSGREVTLRIYAESKDLNKLEFAMESLKNSMKWDEDKYGREYDLDSFNIVAVDDFLFGAMENKSLNIFNTGAVLAHADTQTDTNFKRVEKVVGHEYFHNWTGDRVTCRDWFQLTLKEGLTVYRDHVFSADMGSTPVTRIEEVSELRTRQFAEDASPMSHPIRPDHFVTIDNFYTGTVYQKGGEVIRMLNTLLGDDTYRKATDLYFSRHDGQAVTCDDFVKCMEDASGRDFSQFMLWYSTPGTPTVDASWTYDKQSQKFSLTLKQSVAATDKPLHMPVIFGLVGKDGKDVVLDAATGATQKTLELTQKEQTFTFDNIPEGAVPSILRNFSAPVKLNAPYTDEELRHLMIHDSDGFNQWDAGNRFMVNKMMEQIANATHGKPVVVDPSVIDAYSAILKRTDMDKHLKSFALSLPAYDELEQMVDVVDPQAILAVSKAFSKELADRLGDEWAATYAGNLSTTFGPYKPDTASMAERSLKNRALGFLARASDANGQKTILDLAQDQYNSANNMTDRIAALTTILGMKNAGAVKTSVLKDFYNKYKDEALVVDKWFTVQALSGDVDAVRELAKHPAFNELNPNKMRSVYGAFAANPKAFHAEDGSGYKFLADFIIKIDGKSPQMAARFVDSLGSFKRYKPALADKMKAELERIASMQKISTPLQEKLNAFLGANDNNKNNKAPKKKLG